MVLMRAFSVGVILCCAQTASADRRVSVRDLAEQSATVVLVQTGDMSFREDADALVGIETAVRVTVEAVLYGRAPARLNLAFPGGRVGPAPSRRFRRVTGVPPLAPHQQYLLSS